MLFSSLRANVVRKVQMLSKCTFRSPSGYIKSNKYHMSFICGCLKIVCINALKKRRRRETKKMQNHFFCIHIYTIGKMHFLENPQLEIFQKCSIDDIMSLQVDQRLKHRNCCHFEKLLT